MHPGDNSCSVHVCVVWGPETPGPHSVLVPISRFSAPVFKSSRSRSGLVHADLAVIRDGEGESSNLALCFEGATRAAFALHGTRYRSICKVYRTRAHKWYLQKAHAHMAHPTTFVRLPFQPSDAPASHTPTALLSSLIKASYNCSSPPSPSPTQPTRPPTHPRRKSCLDPDTRRPSSALPPP